MDSLSRFLKSLTDIIDVFSNSYDNFIVMGDFNAPPLDSVIKDFIKVIGLIKLIKENTCFKGQGSRIDLILKAHSQVLRLFLATISPLKS